MLVVALKDFAAEIWQIMFCEYFFSNLLAAALTTKLLPQIISSFAFH
jgi:hypothetical protein